MAIGPGTVVHGCEITSKLAAGGMGTVYLARQQSLNRDVVVKVLHDELISDEEFVKRFYREAQAAGQLNHPHIVGVVDNGTHDGLHYIIMEFVPGNSVHDLIVQRGSLDAEQSLEIVAQAADGLHAAHEAGIIHRDIKPGNLIVSDTGVVKIADFGIAKILGADLTRLTQTDMMVGTIQYVSPEQFDGKRLDGRSDIYSLGITLYQMLTGARPFDNRNTLALVQRQMTEQPPAVHTRNGMVPEEVSRLVDRMIQKRREERFADCAQVGRAIRSLQQVLGYGEEGGRTELLELGISTRRRTVSVNRRWLLIVLAGLAVALSALLGLWLSTRMGS